MNKVLEIGVESAFKDMVRKIQCDKSNSKEFRLCKSLHILGNRECNPSWQCERLKNELEISSY